MKTIGRILACVLLAAAFAKNVLATSAANIEFPKGPSDDDVARFNITRLELIPRPNPRVGGPRSVPGNIFANGSNEDAGLDEARMFGQKRLQFILMPLMYKMGVMMTMLMVLTAISVKGLIVGIMLLVLKFSTFLSKLHSGWHGHVPSQPIHVHVHNSLPYPHSHAYDWEPASGPGNEDHYYYYKG